MQVLPSGYRIHEHTFFFVFVSVVERALSARWFFALFLLDSIVELGTSRRKRFSVGIKSGSLLIVSSLFSELIAIALVPLSLISPLSLPSVS